MLRTTFLLSLLACGPLIAAASAQQVSIGFGRHGVGLRIGTGGPPRAMCPPAAGHWEVRRERVYVEGCERIVHVPARYAWRRDSCGRMVRVCVRPAYDRVVREPGHYEWVERRVWVAHDHHGHGVTLHVPAPR